MEIIGIYNLSAYNNLQMKVKIQKDGRSQIRQRKSDIRNKKILMFDCIFSTHP